MNASLLFLLPFVAFATCGSVTFSTSDLSSGSPSLGNVKASWGTSLDLGGHKTNLNVDYDMKANSGMLKEAKLSGAVDAISYALTQNFASGVTALALSTKKFGATLKASMDSKSMLKEVSAVKTVEKVTLAPSYMIASKVGKIKASYPLMDDVKLNAEVSAKVDDLMDPTTKVEVDYGTTVSDVDISVTVAPLEQTVDVDLKESKTGVVASASFSASGERKVSLKRSVSF